MSSPSCPRSYLTFSLFAFLSRFRPNGWWLGSSKNLPWKKWYQQWKSSMVYTWSIKVVQWTVLYVPGGRSLKDVNAKTKVTARDKIYNIPPNKGRKKYSNIEAHVCQPYTQKWYQKGENNYSDTRRNSGRHPLPDQRQYRSQALADCLPSRFLRLWDRFSSSGLHLQGRLRFGEHSNRLINVERFVPPENVYHDILGRIRKRHDFEMVHWKVSNGMCYSLQYEPRCLEPDKGLTELVTLPSGLDFRLGRHGKWLINITTHKIDRLQGM